jgi:hypothetical protein
MLVGGLFGMAEAAGRSRAHARSRHVPPFVRDADLLAVNARSAVRVLLEAVRPRSVWLPSYLCDALVAAVGPSSSIRWYPIGEDLRPQALDWLAEVVPKDLVVAIDYFGFRAPPDLLGELRDRGAFVIEDASQALLTGGVGEGVDAAVVSPRKFVGVPDGGLLWLTDPRRHDRSLRLPALVPPPPEWCARARLAASLRADFDRGSGDRGWYPIFVEVEATAPVGPYAMSDTARDLIEGAIDFDEVARARRANYATLAALLPSLALLPTLPSDVVPLGFPVRLVDRDRVRASLHDRQIYAPTHWPIDGFVPAAFAASHRLARSILTLPCDQRYGRAEMAAIAAVVLEAAGT